MGLQNSHMSVGAKWKITMKMGAMNKYIFSVAFLVFTSCFCGCKDDTDQNTAQIKLTFSVDTTEEGMIVDVSMYGMEGGNIIQSGSFGEDSWMVLIALSDSFSKSGEVLIIVNYRNDSMYGLIDSQKPLKVFSEIDTRSIEFTHVGSHEPVFFRRGVSTPEEGQ